MYVSRQFTCLWSSHRTVKHSAFIHVAQLHNHHTVDMSFRADILLPNAEAS